MSAERPSRILPQRYGLLAHRCCLPAGGLVSGDMARERERRSWEAEQEAEMAAEEEAERRRAERREVRCQGEGQPPHVAPLLPTASPHRITCWLANHYTHVHMLHLAQNCPASWISLLQLLNEVIDEAAEERQRASAARQQRQAAEARKRERLKAALLRKQLEQAKQQRGQQQQQQRQQEAEAQ